jgi:monofunctional biosynthetic peptidoglycan transglycosylase
MIRAISDNVPARLLGKAEDWEIVNDGVMGGDSSSTIRTAFCGLVFSGQLSLANQGGFASVRKRISQDFDGISAFRLKIRGDGRTYQFRFRTDTKPYKIAWRREFSTVGVTELIEIPLDEFVPVFRGRPVRNTGRLHPASIRYLGFMIADRREGPFKLAIESIDLLYEKFLQE